MVVTRPEPPDGPLASLLAGLGARVLHWPTVEILAPADPLPLHRACARLTGYDWVVFTSARAVEAVAALAEPPSGDTRLAAVGSATASALRDRRWPVHVAPAAGAGARALLAALAGRNLRGRSVLLPRSAIAEHDLERGLGRLGAVVDAVVAYRTQPAQLDAAVCLARIDAGEVDVVTFTSPSTVDGLVRALGPSGFQRLADRARLVALGRTTEDAILQWGCRVAALARPSTLAGLVEAVASVLRGSDPAPSRRGGKSVAAR